MKEEIGRRVRDARTRRKLSQEQLAELAGTSLTSISRLETGKTMVSLEKLILIAEVLDTGLDELLQDFIHEDQTTRTYVERAILLLSKCSEREQEFWVEGLEKFIQIQKVREMQADE